MKSTVPCALEFSVVPTLATFSATFRTTCFLLWPSFTTNSKLFSAGVYPSGVTIWIVYVPFSKFFWKAFFPYKLVGSDTLVPSWATA